MDTNEDGVIDMSGLPDALKNKEEVKRILALASSDKNVVRESAEFYRSNEKIRRNMNMLMAKDDVMKNMKNLKISKSQASKYRKQKEKYFNEENMSRLKASDNEVIVYVHSPSGSGKPSKSTELKSTLFDEEKWSSHGFSSIGGDTVILFVKPTCYTGKNKALSKWAGVGVYGITYMCSFVDGELTSLTDDVYKRVMNSFVTKIDLNSNDADSDEEVEN